MPEAYPYFFFCYSRADIESRGPYIDRFFEELRERVANIAQLAVTQDDPERSEKLNRVGFRDQRGVKLGTDWKTEIGRAVQHCAVLVCLYSPNFFSPPQVKQFCGKEFTAFLLRNDETYYIGGTGSPTEQLQLRGVRNIIPVIWEDPRVMSAREVPLPPYVLNAIQYVPDTGRDTDLINLYQSEGLRKIMQGRRSVKYHNIVDLLALNIFALARYPLPPLPEVPEIEELRNAFWQPPHNAPLDTAASGPTPEQMLADTGRGPAHVMIVQVRRHTVSENWFPFAGEDSMAAAAAQLSNRWKIATRWLDLDPGAPGFVDTAIAAIQKATGSSGRPLLILDARSLADETSRTAILGLLNRPCPAGLLIPADAADAEAIALVEAHKDKLQAADHSGKWVIRTMVGTMADFHVAADSVDSDLLARRVLTDPVQQSPPQNAGPSVRPQMTNRPSDRQDE
jgi:hypothetical protein